MWNGYTGSLRDRWFIFPAGMGLLILLAGLIYWPGISGGFIFDDYPNLKGLELIPLQDSFWHGVRIYLEGGFSGPTKRPVALISFLLEYPSWPFDPAPFKRNNILLHLITSLLVLWLALLVGERAGFTSGRRMAFALFTTALFALHPLHVSTVLYVIQRMTILAALFSVAALIAFMKAMSAIRGGRTLGWLLLFLCYPVLLLLGTFSKETGILVAYFVPLMAICLPWPRIEDWRQRVVAQLVTFGPMLLLFGLMLLDFSRRMMNDPTLVRREFTLVERLLSQPRVIFNYLYDLYVPKIQSSGLYHDNFAVSTSWLSPPTTLIAIVLIASALGVAIWLRKSRPFLALAVLGYLAGHALESTYIGLEMYFEHRNYMPSLFIFLGMAAGISALWASRRFAALAIMAVLIGWVTFATYQQVQLWKNPLMLSLIWAQKSGGSERALLDAANHLQREGYIDQALLMAEEAIAKNPASARAVLYGMAMQCRYGRALQGATLEQAREKLRGQVYHQATYNYLKRILQAKQEGGCAAFSIDELSELVNETFSAKGIRSGNIKALRHYEFGNLELMRGHGDLAAAQYRQALTLRNDVQVGLVEVARLASAGFPALALEHIARVRAHNEKVLGAAQGFTKGSQYQWIKSELSRLEGIIQQDEASQVGSAEKGEAK